MLRCVVCNSQTNKRFLLTFVSAYLLHPQIAVPVLLPYQLRHQIQVVHFSADTKMTSHMGHQKQVEVCELLQTVEAVGGPNKLRVEINYFTPVAASVKFRNYCQ